MNMGRLFITVVAVLGFVISAGCSKPATESPQGQNAPPVTTDMDIVVPDSDADSDSKSGS